MFSVRVLLLLLLLLLLLFPYLIPSRRAGGLEVRGRGRGEGGGLALYDDLYVNTLPKRIPLSIQDRLFHAIIFCQLLI